MAKSILAEVYDSIKSIPKTSKEEDKKETGDKDPVKKKQLILMIYLCRYIINIIFNYILFIRNHIYK